MHPCNQSLSVTNTVIRIFEITTITNNTSQHTLPQTWRHKYNRHKQDTYYDICDIRQAQVATVHQ